MTKSKFAFISLSILFASIAASAEPVRIDNWERNEDNRLESRLERIIERCYQRGVTQEERSLCADRALAHAISKLSSMLESGKVDEPEENTQPTEPALSRIVVYSCQSLSSPYLSRLIEEISMEQVGNKQRYISTHFNRTQINTYSLFDECTEDLLQKIPLYITNEGETPLVGECGCSSISTFDDIPNFSGWELRMHFRDSMYNQMYEYVPVSFYGEDAEMSCKNFKQRYSACSSKY